MILSLYDMGLAMAEITKRLAKQVEERQIKLEKMLNKDIMKKERPYRHWDIFLQIPGRGMDT